MHICKVNFGVFIEHWVFLIKPNHTMLSYSPICVTVDSENISINHIADIKHELKELKYK